MIIMEHKLWLLLLLKLTGISCMEKVIEDLLTPLKQMGETCGYASCPIQQKDVINVHIVPHTHGELGGTRTFFEHYTGHDSVFMKSQINMKRILDFTITELYAHPSRTFTLSDMPFFFHWWANRDETVRRMVYMLLRQGRLFLVGGGWSMSDEATTNYHAVIEHFTYSLRKINATFLECGRPLVAWQADCYGHSREFASLISQMGFDGLFINPISFDDELERMKMKTMEFVWRGSDDLGADSDIFTHKLFDGYWSPPGFCFGGQCSDPLIITSSDDFNNFEERIKAFVENVKHRQSPYYPTRNIMVMMGQKFGYYDASVWFTNIDKLIYLVNLHNYQNKVGISVFYSTPACYLKAVYAENPKLPTKQDDFFPFAHDRVSYGTGYFTSRPSVKYLAREGHTFLQISKQLLVTAQLKRDFNKFFEDFLWINGAFQDHSVITGAMRPHVVQYYVEKMTKQINMALVGVIRNSFNKLRGGKTSSHYYKCRFNISSCDNTGGPHYFVMVYNPLAWNVTMAVRLPTAPLIYTVTDPQGKPVKAAQVPVPLHILRHPENRTRVEMELVFYAEDVPPMGYKSYCIMRKSYGWIRPKRSLFKKINQKKPKKYLVRQTNLVSGDDIPFDDDAEYTEGDTTTSRYETKIVFGNVSAIDYESRFTGVLTPKSPIDRSTTESSSTTDSTTPYQATTVFDNTTTTDKTTIKITEFSTTSTTASTTEKVIETTKMIRRYEAKEKEVETSPPSGYVFVNSRRPYFNNKYIRVNLDESRRVHSILLANGIKISLDIKFFFYVADDPLKLNKEGTSPGAYLFRPMDDKQEEIIDNSFETKLYKTGVHREYHCVLSKYASYVLKLYANTSVLEIDWMVGPIPVEDGLGKEVFIKYATDLNNKGVFYTDANGRQTVKRIRNTRATYKPLNPDPIAGNIYPVTSKIHIEDTAKNIRFSVFTDRAQGGSSLQDGEIDLMVHRRLLTDDVGIQAYLNETESNDGLIIRGTHYLYISKADHRPTRVYEKKLAKEINLKPKVFVSDMYGFGRNTLAIWMRQNNQFSALNTKLPLGVHILTLERWNWGTILLRLENYLEKEDVVLSGIKTVKLRGLFKNFEIKHMKETTLSAHIWMKDFVPLNWNKHKFLKNFNQAYGNNTNEYAEDKKKDFEDVDLDKGVVLEPQQIRTFVVWYEATKK